MFWIVLIRQSHWLAHPALRNVDTYNIPVHLALIQPRASTAIIMNEIKDYLLYVDLVISFLAARLLFSLPLSCSLGDAGSLRMHPVFPVL